MKVELGSLAKYFWQYEPKADNKPQQLDYETIKTSSKTPESTAMSKALKKKG